jgi:hypothetical protein
MVASLEPATIFSTFNVLFSNSIALESRFFSLITIGVLEGALVELPVLVAKLNLGRALRAGCACGSDRNKHTGGEHGELRERTRERNAGLSNVAESSGAGSRRPKPAVKRPNAVPNRRRP